MRFKGIFFFAADIALVLASCSLNYTNSAGRENSTPEIVSRNAVFSRVEDGKTSFSATAEKIEQYRDDGTSYAQNVSFKSYGEDGELNSEGVCTIMAANSGTEECIFLDGVEIKSYSPELEIAAENLRWNGKSEQLSSGKGDTVTIEKDGVKISGADFSASAVSRSFSYGENVSGTIETKGR